MNGYIEQKPQAIQLGFVASCIEFYDVLHTQSRERLHNEATGLYLMSDLYIVDEFMNEMQGK